MTRERLLSLEREIRKSRREREHTERPRRIENRERLREVERVWRETR